MKKLLMLLFLMTISLGQSQTFPLDFSDSADLIPGVDGVATSIVQDNNDSVLQIVGSNGTWDNCQAILAQNLDLSDNANNTITFRFKSTGAETSGQHLLKFEGGTGGAAVAEGFFTASGTEWQTITIDFGAGLGVYSKIVIFTDSGASSNGWNNTTSGTYLIDDIAGGTNVAPVVVPAPTVAATTPTLDAADVISIFSGAYTNVAGTNFFPGWGQSTQYTLLNVAQNPTIKYSSLNYEGVQFATGIDVSSMEKLHIDIWTADCNSFQLYLIGGGENAVTLTPSLNGWNSYDIPLSSYAERTLNNIIQLKFVGNGTVYLDNIYFWKVPAGTYTYYADADADGYGAGSVFLSAETSAPQGYSVNNTDCNDTNAAINPGATEVLDGIDNDCDGLTDEGLLPTVPTTSLQPQTRNAWDVISVYTGGGSYADLETNLNPYWGQQTTYSTVNIENNNVILYSNLNYQGITLNTKSSTVGNPDAVYEVNVSAMTKLHLDVWTPDVSSFNIFLIANGDNPVTLNPTLSGWNSFDIDLATQYAGRNLTKAIQLKLERVGGSGASSFYVDNIYFYRPATAEPPTLGEFTIPAKAMGAADFDLIPPTSNGAGAFTFTSSNTAVATISGTTVHIVGAGLTTITATQATDGTYAAISVIATLDVLPAEAAPTPTVPADRVLTVFSGAAGYSNVAGTDFRPNWGQATQYAQVDVVGNPTLKYSDLNYEGVQLGSVLDVSTYDTLHIDVYGAGTTALTFRVINQVGGAGSSDLAHEANTALTLLPGQWNSFDIPLSSLTGLELNRIGQLMFIGSGTIYVDNIYFSKAVPTAVAPTVADTSFCKGLGIALTATPSGNNQLKWYTVATKGTALASAPIPTATKTYYVAQVMSNGVISDRVAITATMNALPTTPSKLELTSESVVIKKVGNFIGTTTPLTLTATAAGTVATDHYIWTLPTLDGVNQTDGGSTGVITVNFADVQKGNTAIDLFVKSVSAAGCVSTTAKKLTVTRSEAGTPKSLTLTDAELPLVAKITKLDAYTGAAMKSTRVLTLTATPNVIAGSQATSYKWVLPETVVVTSSTLSSELELDGIGTRTVTTTGNVLEFTLANVTNQTSFLFKVYGVNKNGTSATSKDLTCTSAAPKTPGTITTPLLAAPKFNPSCATSTTITVQVPSVLGVSYAWTVAGSTDRIVSGNGTNSIVINVAGVTTPKLLLSVVASTGTGSSIAKTLDISKITTCGTRIAPEAATATEAFSAVAYPNPSSTEGFRVKSSNGKSFGVQVYDMLGRSIEQRQMSSDAQIGSNYAKGIYNVIVTQDANVKTLRVIKK